MCKTTSLRGAPEYTMSLRAAPEHKFVYITCREGKMLPHRLTLPQAFSMSVSLFNMDMFYFIYYSARAALRPVSLVVTNKKMISIPPNYPRFIQSNCYTVNLLTDGTPEVGNFAVSFSQRLLWREEVIDYVTANTECSTARQEKSFT